MLLLSKNICSISHIINSFITNTTDIIHVKATVPFYSSNDNSSTVHIPTNIPVHIKQYIHTVQVQA